MSEMNRAALGGLERGLADIDEMLAGRATTAVEPPHGTIIRFTRHVMGTDYTYAAIYVGRVWYVTGSLAGRRTYDHESLSAILAEDETSDVAVAETWTQLIV